MSSDRIGKKNKSRKPAKLPGALVRRLDAYALAATAAGVGLFACPLPAEGTVVCKDLSVTLLGNDTLPLNPANQAIAPVNLAQTTFYFYSFSSGLGFWNRGFFLPNPQGVMLDAANNFPAAVSAGALIGPSQHFATGNSYGLLFSYGPGTLYTSKGGGTFNKHRGNFKFGQTNYVGFRYLAAGQYYYGWARVEVFFRRVGIDLKVIQARMKIPTYGYETAPNTAIAAGDCSGASSTTAQLSGDVRSISNDGVSGQPSLGLLALGDLGLSTWRRNGNKSSQTAGNFAPAQASNPKSN